MYTYSFMLSTLAVTAVVVAASVNTSGYDDPAEGSKEGMLEPRRFRSHQLFDPGIDDFRYIYPRSIEHSTYDGQLFARSPFSYRNLRRRASSDSSIEEAPGSHLYWGKDPDDEVPRKKAAGEGKGSERSLSPSAPEGPPHVGQLILEWTGRTLQKQQRTAHTKAKAPRYYGTWSPAEKLNNQVLYLKNRNAPLPKGLQEEANRAKRRHSRVCEKYWAGRDTIKQKGQDIENIGMVNKHLQKCMQKSFPAMRINWGIDDKKRRLRQIEEERQRAENMKHQAKFSERMKRKRERKGMESPKAKETSAQKGQRLIEQGPAIKKARRERDEKAGRFKEHDRERFQGLGALFSQRSRSSQGSRSSLETSAKGKSDGSRKTRTSMSRGGKDSSPQAEETKDVQSAAGRRKRATNTLKKTGARLKSALLGCIGGGYKGQTSHKSG